MGLKRKGNLPCGQATHAGVDERLGLEFCNDLVQDCYLFWLGLSDWNRTQSVVLLLLSREVCTPQVQAHHSSIIC